MSPILCNRRFHSCHFMEENTTFFLTSSNILLSRNVRWEKSCCAQQLSPVCVSATTVSEILRNMEPKSLLVSKTSMNLETIFKKLNCPDLTMRAGRSGVWTNGRAELYPEVLGLIHLGVRLKPTYQWSNRCPERRKTEFQGAKGAGIDSPFGYLNTSTVYFDLRHARIDTHWVLDGSIKGDTF